MTFALQLQVLITAAKNSGLSEKAVAFIRRAGETAEKTFLSTSDVGMDDVVLKVYRALHDDGEEKTRIFNRAPGEKNWGEEALIFIQSY